MKRIILLFVWIITFQFNYSQISDFNPGSVSIAQTSVANTRNWSSFNNPSILAFISHPEAGFSVENRYLLSELSSKSVQFGLPTKLLNLGVSFNHFGYSLYHEMLLGIGFARNYSDKFALGLQFNYYTAFFSASNSYRGAFLPQVGISVKLSNRFNLGFQSFNPFQTNIKTNYIIKRIPSIFSLGTQYYLSDDLVWRTQMDKEVSSNYRFATGFEYQMLQKMSVKLGAYGSDYLVPCIGLGFNMSSFLIDFNCELHPLLGLNTFAAIKYRFSSTK